MLAPDNATGAGQGAGAEMTGAATESPPRGFVSWEDLDAPQLDPAVRPLVGALNRTSWARTVFSCAGHPEGPDSVARGRRQAHVDVVVSDPTAWRAYVRRVKRAAPAAVRRLQIPGVRLRCAEGSLGPPPGWLQGALAGLAAGPATPGPGAAETPWWRRLLPPSLSVARRPPAGRWRYRRLVLEPVPYALAPDVCRRVLDTALAAALDALA